MIDFPEINHGDFLWLPDTSQKVKSYIHEHDIS